MPCYYCNAKTFGKLCRNCKYDKNISIYHTEAKKRYKLNDDDLYGSNLFCIVGNVRGFPTTKYLVKDVEKMMDSEIIICLNDELINTEFNITNISLKLLPLLEKKAKIHTKFNKLIEERLIINNIKFDSATINNIKKSYQYKDFYSYYLNHKIYNKELDCNHFEYLLSLLETYIKTIFKSS